MSNAELLPDNINMITEDGDVVVRDTERDQSVTPEPIENLYSDPPEADFSANYSLVEEIIKDGIEQSRTGGYGSLKVRPGDRMKPLGQFLAVDLYKYGLSADEARSLLEKYLPLSVETLQGRESIRRELGHRATAAIGEPRYFDARERASGLHKEFDD